MAAGGRHKGTQQIADPGEAREKAAESVGINRQYVSDAKRIASARTSRGGKSPIGDLKISQAAVAVLNKRTFQTLGDRGLMSDYSSKALKVIAFLTEAFPHAFFIYKSKRRPLKIGIFADLRPLVPFADADLRAGLNRYTRSYGYLRSCTKGRCAD
jgi:hypothetical protein